MNKEEIYAKWAPEASVWSRWVKPVLFAYLDILEPGPLQSTGGPTSLLASARPSSPSGVPAFSVAEPATGSEAEQSSEPAVPETSWEWRWVPARGWVKSIRPEPVLHTAWETEWVPATGTRSALVLDLPGAEGVLLGLELGARGYRPVPLYNAVPLPGGEPPFDPLTSRPVAAVQVLPILHAFKKGAAILDLIDLPPDAPPVFLLDANRRGEGRKMLPDEFDNRSVCFTTDFPSANFLSAQRISCVVLVQRSGEQPQLDLAHVLRRWQKAGIAIHLKQLDVPGPPVPCEIARPSWFGAMFQRALSLVGLHRGEAGGFGAWITNSSAGG
jgi:hypothetical protein